MKFKRNRQQPLTPEQVATVMERHDQKVKPKIVAEEFNCDVRTIYKYYAKAEGRTTARMREGVERKRHRDPPAKEKVPVNREARFYKSSFDVVALNKKPLIFVFGSNLAGRHGMGAAHTALKMYGAIYGRGTGRQGNSYAIPTKDAALKTLPLDVIERYVKEFIQYAKERPDLEFFITAIGTGLAGYSHEQIKPMFNGASANCRLPLEWKL